MSRWTECCVRIASKDVREFCLRSEDCDKYHKNFNHGNGSIIIHQNYGDDHRYTSTMVAMVATMVAMVATTTTTAVMVVVTVEVVVHLYTSTMVATTTMAAMVVATVEVVVAPLHQ